MKELIVKRPDGNILYRQLISENGADVLLGKLVVRGGRLTLLSCAGESWHAPGSVVTPDCPWIGDMNFSVEDCGAESD